MSIPDEAAQSRCARDLYSERKYTDAAEVFEMMWRSSGAAKYLYNAAEARVAAGSDGWALALLTQYLDTPGLTDSERAEATERSHQVLTRLIAVDVEIFPLAALGEEAVLHLERAPADGANCDKVDPKPPTRGGHTVEHGECHHVQSVASERFSYSFSRVAHGSGVRLHLDHGRWTIWVDPVSRAAAYNLGGKAHATSIHADVGARGRIELHPETSEIVFELRPSNELSRGVMITLSDPLQIDPDYVLRARPPEIRLVLRKGPWRYHARPRGLSREVRRGDVVIGEERAIELRWDPNPALLAERALQQRIMLGLGGTSAGALLLGAVLLGVGRSQPNCYRLGPSLFIEGPEVVSCDDDSSAYLYYDARVIGRRHDTSVAGGGFLGASLGLAVATGLESLRPNRARLIAGLVCGGAVTVVGSVLFSAALTDYRNSSFSGALMSHYYVKVADMERRETFGALSAGVLGLGAGVVLGIGSAAITREFLGRRMRLAANVSSAALAVNLQGRF